MNFNVEETVRQDFQVILDLIAFKNPIEAQKKLENISEKVIDLIDFSSSDDDILILGRYQLLIQHLKIKIDRLKTSLN
ncbi:MAG: hypothetical protein H7239_10970 [Flavobacterium sp.]|nr:hypothetical protein [Flavobacterium sp.]